MSKSAVSPRLKQTRVDQKSRGALARMISHDIAVDLGTANTLIFIDGKGVVVDVPSMVATNKTTNQVVAIGVDAKHMQGRTPKNIRSIKPLVDGVVSDYEVAEYMLRTLISKMHSDHRAMFHRPRIIIGLPCGVTEVEQRAVEEAARSAGARKVYLIQEPVAAAIGAGIDISSEEGAMMVDIGGGTTEIAIVANGNAVITKSIRIAGDEMNDAVRQFVRDEFSIQIGERTAEEIKMEIGAVDGKVKKRSMKVRGRNVVSGLPQEIEVSSEMLRPILVRQFRPIIEAIKAVLDETPPELISDIMKSGIYIAGGGSLIAGIDKLVRSETHIDVVLPKNALTAVVEGAAIALADPLKYRSVLIYTE